MTAEMCPSCRKSCDMRHSDSTREITLPNGNRKTVKTVSFHCAECHQFVRSEERDEKYEKDEKDEKEKE